MKIRICSGFSPVGRSQYGERFLKSFDRYWPADHELAVYVEEPMPMPRGACRDLFAIPGAREFHVKHGDNLAAQGRAPQPCWKGKEVTRGYSFRTDAYKFWKQILIPGAAAADMVDGDILVWLDGDVDTFRDIPPDWISKLLGTADVAYLGRARSHSEIGFWAIRLGEPARYFLGEIAKVYTSGRVFDLPEWHSAYVWDHVRKSLPIPLRERNLCKPHAHGHVWPMTPLASFTRHDKGGRKPR